MSRPGNSVGSSMIRRARRLILWFGVAALLCVACAGAGFAYYALVAMPVASSPLQFSIRAGSSLRGAARQMAAAGVLRYPELFVLLARIRGQEGSLKAGIYEIESAVSPLALLRKVTEGDYTLVSLTLVEGWTFRQVRDALAAHDGIQHDLRDLPDAEVANRLEIGHSSPEGWFFPDTYFFSHGTSEFRILRRANRLMRDHLAAQWARRATDLPLATPYEALILASIIEKETGRPDERPLIAAVLANRLRRGMKLQTDPTVIYGMGAAFDGNLRKADLLADSAWNTYTRAGLPPTPIAIPGLASLAAAMSPARSDALYFVAKGRGSSVLALVERARPGSDKIPAVGTSLMRGRFITLEGIDGAGKSTHLQWLASRLAARGIEAQITREPGGTAVGERLRSLLLDHAQDLTPETETLLLFGARCEHLARVIRPALERGTWVICDRFTDATYAYQAGGSGVAWKQVEALEQWAHRDLQPDLTLLFDLPPEVARARAGGRSAPDRFEREAEEYFKRVREAYLRRARDCAERIRVIDAAAGILEIQNLLEEIVLSIC